MAFCGFESSFSDGPYFQRKNVLPEPWPLHLQLALRSILGSCLWCPCARLCTHWSLAHLHMPMVWHKGILHRVWPEVMRREGVWTFGQGGILLLGPGHPAEQPCTYLDTPLCLL